MAYILSALIDERNRSAIKAILQFYQQGMQFHHCQYAECWGLIQIQQMKMNRWSHLCARKEIRISLDPGDDLTQDNTIGEHVSLKTDGQMQMNHLKMQNMSKIIPM